MKSVAKSSSVAASIVSPPKSVVLRGVVKSIPLKSSKNGSSFRANMGVSLCEKISRRAAQAELDVFAISQFDRLPNIELEKG